MSWRTKGSSKNDKKPLKEKPNSTMDRYKNFLSQKGIADDNHNFY